MTSERDKNKSVIKKGKTPFKLFKNMSNKRFD